ncbi:MAG: SH3 domain-containing protein, partial [Bacteroidota bacterium]
TIPSTFFLAERHQAFSHIRNNSKSTLSCVTKQRKTEMKHCWFFIALMILASCGNPSKEVEKAKKEAELAQAEVDSLRQLLESKTAKTPDKESPQKPIRQVFEKGKLNPVDEGPLNKTWVAFEKKLRAAIIQEDVQFILKHTDPEIKASFGDDGGLDGFKAIWFSDRNQTKSFFQILERLLDMGGTYDNKDKQIYSMPYVFTTWPEDDFDAFTYAAIVGEGVRLRDEPSTRGARIGSLSYDIVRKTGNQSDEYDTIGGDSYPWVEIELADGTTGWIWEKYVYSPIDFRAGWEQTEESWQLFFFVAGD